MKTILIFVTSLDGKITKWGDPKIRSWSSKSDQDYFDTIWSETRVIVMGSGTYAPDPIKPDPKHLFIVMTTKPENYRKNGVAGLIEFTCESPSDIVSRIKKEGEENLLIVGGAKIATSFLRQELIDELWLTIEPKIFGTGIGFVTEEKLDIILKLLSCSKANAQGTIMLKYIVIHDKREINK